MEELQAVSIANVSHLFILFFKDFSPSNTEGTMMLLAWIKTEQYRYMFILAQLKEPMHKNWSTFITIQLLFNTTKHAAP